MAENSGGAHCLKYGFTVHHVTGLEIVTPAGELTWLGDGTGAAPGYDLVGAFTGSEGTLGIATKVVVRLTRIPEAVTTLLAAFRTIGAAGAAVSAIIGAGILPAAIEMMDALAIEAAEAAVALPLPGGRGRGADRRARRPRGRGGARRRPRSARSARPTAPSRSARPTTPPSARRSGPAASRRSRPWAGSARPTSCRTAWSRGPRWATVLDRIAALSAASGVRVANVFHAGDGNLHPLVLFDDAKPGAEEAAEEVSGAILDLCIAHGGSITGEHGVGVDKAKYMPKMFSPGDLDTMQLLRCAFDPAGLCNPGKIFPTPRLCGEVPGVTARAASAGGLRRPGAVLISRTLRPRAGAR